MHAIRTTGRFSQPPLLSDVRSGLRTRTSSAVASQRGRPPASTASWRNSARLPFGLTSFGRECTDAVDIAGARFELYGPNEPSKSRWVRSLNFERVRVLQYSRDPIVVLDVVGSNPPSRPKESIV